MHNTLNLETNDMQEKINNNALERQQLHDVTTIAAELRRLLVKFHECLDEEGFTQEIVRLESWLESERNGPAPALIITVGAITWLKQLRERLKLSADELQRLRSEGGNACGPDQNSKTEDLIQAVSCIDQILEGKPHITN